MFDPIYIKCPRCNAEQDRLCGDEDGEWPGGTYHAERMTKND